MKQTGQDGTVTETEYGPNAIPVKETATGSDGLVTETVNTLTDDKENIAKTVTRANTAEHKDQLQVTGSTELKHDQYGRMTEQVRSPLTARNARYRRRRSPRTRPRRPSRSRSPTPKGSRVSRWWTRRTRRSSPRPTGRGRRRSTPTIWSASRPKPPMRTGRRPPSSTTVAGPAGTGINATVTTAPGGYATRTVTDALGREIRAEDNYDAEPSS